MLFDLGWACARMAEAEDGSGPVIVIFTPEGASVTLDAATAREGLQALCEHMCSMEPADIPDTPTEPLDPSPEPSLHGPAETPILDPDDSEPLHLDLSTSLLTQTLPTKKGIDFSDLDGL